MPRIYVLSGPDLGRTFDVSAGATFGRTAECQVILRDASVSRAHARLERGESGWRVVDSGSRNGLYLRDARVPTVELSDGDEFRLGEVVLRFRDDAANVAVALRGEPGAEPPAQSRAEIPAASAEPSAPPVAEIHFHARGVSRAEPADEPLEIELEGDWSQPSAPPPPPRGLAETARASAETARASAVTPVAAPRSTASEARAKKLAAAGLGATARTGGADARGVLQFNKVEQQEGILRQELDQQPLWVRLTVIAVVLVVVTALAWFGYQAATATKARLAPAEAVEDEAR